MPRVAKTLEQLEQRRLAKNAAGRAWRADNKAYFSELTRTWREENATQARANHNAWIANNREASRAIANKWARANPEKRKATNAARYLTADKDKIKTKHKIWRDRRQLEQAGRPKPSHCEVCGRPPSKNGLHFDHCHETKKFRGWLCHGCNIALGGVDDSIEILVLLAKFLKKHKPKAITKKKGLDR